MAAMTVIASLALIVGLSACGAPTPSASAQPPASVPEPSALLMGGLVGPWRPTPQQLDAAAVGEMDAACLAFRFMAPSVSRVAVDARGEGRVILVYAGEDGQQGVCEATVQADGQSQSGPVSNTNWPQEIEVIPLADDELRVVGAYGSPGSAAPGDRWFAAIGQAGSGIEQVVADVPGHGSAIVASMSNGWWVLWFPVRAPGEWRFLGLDATGDVVAESQ